MKLCERPCRDWSRPSRRILRRSCC